MRILLVIRRALDVGGAQTQLRLLAAELVRRGARVTIVTERMGRLRPPAFIQGIPVHAIRSSRLRFVRTVMYAVGLAWYLIARRATYDVSLVFFLKESALVAVAAGAFARRPVVVRPAGAGPTGDLAYLADRPFRRRLIRLCRRADAFVALSDDLVEELAAFGCPRGRIHRIPSGIAVPAEVPPAETAPPVVVFAGRLDPNKGLAALLCAWRRVLEREPRAQLILYGQGPHRAELEQLVCDLHVAQSVVLAGLVDDVPARLLAARGFVLPSVAEGMSSALLEAAVAGRAVVASRVSGTAEVIRDGRDGLLVEPGDVNGLAEALTRVVTDPALAGRLGRSARARVAGLFSAARLADSHLALFRGLLRHSENATDDGRKPD